MLSFWLLLVFFLNSKIFFQCEGGSWPPLLFCPILFQYPSFYESFLACFFSLFAVLSLNAQFGSDELVLKSGKIVTGSIIKRIPQTSVEVLLADSSTIVIA